MISLVKLICFFFLICFNSVVFAQTTQTLPESVFGEWQNHTKNGDYSGKLIHKDFLEFGYRAFMYQEITRKGDHLYDITAKDIQGNIVKYELQVISNDSIQLKLDDNAFETYSKRIEPIDATRLTVSAIPEAFKRNWYTTDGEDHLEFKVSNQTITFRNKEYSIEDLVLFGSKEKGQYRFVVKNGDEYWMFYFKNWNEHYLQVGFNGQFGDLYKANKEYPDFRIDDISGYMTSIIPKELRGNWLKADGLNLWSHSFYYNYAVIDQTIWNYKSVKKKGKKYILMLERNGEEKIMYAQPNATKKVNFGYNRKDLVTYSLEKIDSSNFKELNSESNDLENILKNGTATYSGIIRGFNKNNAQKTGKISVDNVFTGEQDSYLININDDGRFSVSFPSYHLQQVYVQLPGSYAAIYVAPDKETWQLVNSGNKSEGFFAGDLAQLNTDYASLSFLVFDREYYNSIIKNIKNLSPQEYKTQCLKLKEKQLAQLDSIYNTRFLSKRAHELMALDLEYRGYMHALGYDMHNRTPYKDKANVNKAYIDFITPEVLNNKKAILTSSYSSFINRLKFLRHLRGGMNVPHPNIAELGKILKTQGVVLNADEEELRALHNAFTKENADILQKQKDFNNKYQSVHKKIGVLYQKMTEEERKDYLETRNMNFDALQAFAKSKNIDVVFTEEEQGYKQASENLLTKEERERLARFHSGENSKRNSAFIKKYKAAIDKYVSGELKKKGIEKIRENLGSNFSSDIIVAQEVLGSLTRYFMPLANKELDQAKTQVKQPFIANIFKIENDKLKAKIEANKTKSGYVVNKTTNTEADKVFDNIISKYKSKVIFIDFWATWCGPCRSGIKKMKPLKDELKDEDIVFVYITNPSSPETTYNNMIPDIKGEHYRVSQDEWNYLASKFNITGIPHYTLVNKEGEVVKNKIYFASSPDQFNKKIKEYLE